MMHLMNKAAFFDRDGVINNDSGQYYISDPNDFKLNPGVIELLSWLRTEGFLLIIISNQGGISKGFFTKSDTDRVHSRMKEIVKAHGLEFDEIYYCPHHPDNERCICRKPDTVQIEKALSRFSINAGESFFIGDRETDIEAGNNSGLRTILVNANQDMKVVIERIKESVNKIRSGDL
jgi:D-glycero-D-manno-heptose 1,7-bisphosphate phosphatase